MIPKNGLTAFIRTIQTPVVQKYLTGTDAFVLKVQSSSNEYKIHKWGSSISNVWFFDIETPEPGTIAFRISYVIEDTNNSSSLTVEQFPRMRIVEISVLPPGIRETKVSYRAFRKAQSGIDYISYEFTEMSEEKHFQQSTVHDMIFSFDDLKFCTQNEDINSTSSVWISIFNDVKYDANQILLDMCAELNESAIEHCSNNIVMG